MASVIISFLQFNYENDRKEELSMTDSTYKMIQQLNEIDFMDNSEKMKKQMIKIIEKVQQEAFMEGYKYAITILEDGIVKKEKTD